MHILQKLYLIFLIYLFIGGCGDLITSVQDQLFQDLPTENNKEPVSPTYNSGQTHHKVFGTHSHPSDEEFWEIAVVGEGFSDLQVHAGEVRPCNAKNSTHCIGRVSDGASISVSHSGPSGQCYFANLTVLCGKHAGCFESFDGLPASCDAVAVTGPIVFGFSEFYEPTKNPMCGDSSKYPTRDCHRQGWECNPTFYASINCKPCRFCGSRGACLSDGIEHLCNKD